MSNTFTQAIRCFECAYVECRCGRLRRTPQPRAIIATEYRPVSRPADVQPMKTRAAELAPAKVKASVLPPALAEIREKMRRGEFECAVCGKTHFHHAPPACCRAYSSGEF